MKKLLMTLGVCTAGVGTLVGTESVGGAEGTTEKPEVVAPIEAHELFPLITLIDATTANGRWYLHDLNTQEGVDNPLILYGIYDDVYKKVFGKWLIQRTKIDFLWPKRQYTGFRNFEKENGK